jgi:hypothetical protein
MSPVTLSLIIWCRTCGMPWKVWDKDGDMDSMSLFNDAPVGSCEHGERDGYSLIEPEQFG